MPEPTEMRLFVAGLPSRYHVEQLCRMFYPRLTVAADPPAQGDCVIARVRDEALYATLRQGETQLSDTQPLTPGLDPEYALARMVYQLASKATGIRPDWGMLTGVRPVRMIHAARAAGRGEAEIEDEFLTHYDCTREKFLLARGIADLQRPLLAKCGPRDYSLYVGIPFCPSRCSYCSFVSRAAGADGALMQPYVDALCRELAAFRAQADHNRLRLRTVYIGGGTPTSLSVAQLTQLMQAIGRLFDLSQVEEYTVEAGRPDCTDEEKLRIILREGAGRISINPQTFSDAVLAGIGRRHTAQDILDCYAAARRVGHTCINMDLIAGLPGDTPAGFAQSLRTAVGLAPENITVHTLTRKRASDLVIEDRETQDAGVAAMLACAGDVLRAAGYRPYYLYRQKGTLQNRENIGWSRPDYEGRYNIYIMEEAHSILSAGCGGSTKLVAPGGRMQRIFNYKYPNEYLAGFSEILRRKEGVSEFYGKYLDH